MECLLTHETEKSQTEKEHLVFKSSTAKKPRAQTKKPGSHC